MAKDDPLVSVIIPVWNTGKNVKKLMQKLFDQTYRKLEIVAIDDGSSDNSLQILRELAKNDSRLKVIHQENAGASAARNAGIGMVQGKYLVFIDSDDDVMTNFVEVLVKAMEESPKAVLALTGKRYNKLQEDKVVDDYIAKRRKRREKEQLSHYIIYLMLLDGRMYSITSRIFLADTIQKYNIRFDEGRDFAEDTKFMIDYLMAKDGELIFIPQTLYIYNFGTETSTVGKSSLDWGNWEESYRDLEEWARSENSGKLDIGTWVLLKLVRARWHVSHYKAKKRARLSKKATS